MLDSLELISPEILSVLDKLAPRQICLICIRASQLA